MWTRPRSNHAYMLLTLGLITAEVFSGLSNDLFSENFFDRKEMSDFSRIMALSLNIEHKHISCKQKH